MAQYHFELLQIALKYLVSRNICKGVSSDPSSDIAVTAWPPPELVNFQLQNALAGWAASVED